MRGCRREAPAPAEAHQRRGLASPPASPPDAPAGRRDRAARTRRPPSGPPGWSTPSRRNARRRAPPGRRAARPDGADGAPAGTPGPPARGRSAQPPSPRDHRDPVGGALGLGLGRARGCRPPDRGPPTGCRSTAPGAAALSASLSRGRSDRRRSGSAAALASRWPQWRARRSTVAPSNRSELCSIQPSIPPLLDSSRRSDRSNCTAPGNVSAGRSARPGSASSGSGSLRSVNKTWNSGPRERSRSGCSASTSCSKGSSACA